ncbi:hypothetical protein LCGC14_2972260, partial [marine sediment metagenome]
MAGAQHAAPLRAAEDEPSHDDRLADGDGAGGEFAVT